MRKVLTIIIACIVILLAVDTYGVVQRVIIIKPEDNAIFSAGEKVTFEGRAIDSQGRPILGDKLIWTSDGQLIGQGSAFKAILSIGTHIISLTAIDESEDSSSTQVTIKIE